MNKIPDVELVGLKITNLVRLALEKLELEEHGEATRQVSYTPIPIQTCVEVAETPLAVPTTVLMNVIRSLGLLSELNTILNESFENLDRHPATHKIEFSPEKSD